MLELKDIAQKVKKKFLNKQNTNIVLDSCSWDVSQISKERKILNKQNTNQKGKILNKQILI